MSMMMVIGKFLLIQLDLVIVNHDQEMGINICGSMRKLPILLFISIVLQCWVMSGVVSLVLG